MQVREGVVIEPLAPLSAGENVAVGHGRRGGDLQQFGGGSVVGLSRKRIFRLTPSGTPVTVTPFCRLLYRPSVTIPEKSLPGALETLGFTLRDFS